MKIAKKHKKTFNREAREGKAGWSTQLDKAIAPHPSVFASPVSLIVEVLQLWPVLCISSGDTGVPDHVQPPE